MLGEDGPGDTNSIGSDEECRGLLRISELLIQKLQRDRRFVRFAIGLDPPRAVEQARLWLDDARRAYGMFHFTAHHVTPALLEGPAFDGLVEALLDAMRRPLPLGEDVLTAALAVLGEEMRADARVSGFLEHVLSVLEEAASPTEEALSCEEPPAEEVALAGLGPAESLLDGGVPAAEGPPGLGLDGGEAPPAGAARAEEEINAQSLGQLVLEPDVMWEVRRSWEEFCSAAPSREAAGGMIYSALFDGAPSLQALFTTPRAVQAGRFLNSLQGFVDALQEPARLRALTEVLGFGHLNLEITPGRVVVFRDSILDVLQTELAERFGEAARLGWVQLLNYIGGALLFVKMHYSSRLGILKRSWAAVNDQSANNFKARKLQVQESSDSLSTKERGECEPVLHQSSKKVQQEDRWKHMRRLARAGAPSPVSEKGSSAEHTGSGEATGPGNGTQLSKQMVPTTYNEMFEVNSAVMGFNKNGIWFKEVLRSFDAIVNNAANAIRLQEECDVLSLRISKVTSGQVNLSEYKSCMLAALGSLLPKVWDSSHEVAWSWLWDNVERLLLHNLGRPARWEREAEALVAGLEEGRRREIRQRIYDRFFELAPAGQDHFKQSSTRLHYIAGQVMEMTVDLYREPWQMVEAISAVGLRHVGYGVPTELFGPFLTAHIEVVRTVTENEEALEAYQWSLSLIAKILVRTITEGSTIVMRAINTNSVRMLRTALCSAPRCSRVEWLLNIQVGTCKISPLEWAIASGNLEVADAAIKDLLTIRADRDRYYFGVDELFGRHPDIVQRLCDEAPSLLPTLLEGLVWRSRQTKNGVRRVNFFVRHIIVNEDGSLSDALRSLAASKDQAIISHPVVVLVSDTLWTGVIRRSFFLSKVGFIFSVLVFMLSQAILPKVGGGEGEGVRVAVLIGRTVTYVFSLGRLLFSHASRICRGYRTGRTLRVLGVPVPRYLHDPYMAFGLVLMLLLLGMCATEPMLHCMGSSDWPTENCDGARELELRYTLLSVAAMVVHWLLLVDMVAFSTKLQAFLLVFSHIMSELGRFLVAMLFLLATFSSAITCLRHGKSEFSTILSSANCLFAITVGLYEGDYREMTHEPFLLLPVFLFVTVSTILLINLLIAQLNCSYEYVYQDMVGFARLARAKLIVETLASCPPHRWRRFVDSLKLEQPVEFDEGDVGLAGGIQVRELASLHRVAADGIQRFGGSCAPEMPWPEAAEDEDRVERVERLVQAAYKQAGKLLGRSGPSVRSFSGASGSRASSEGAGSRASSGEGD
mmetsp:Transcript_41263/g.119321  ORF Transcript_41263/g.119321 Transcript_41263/m.119321 type:complete len:1270 (-) Transcript_41263:20-3829(-)